jgi:hypothetical protein
MTGNTVRVRYTGTYAEVEIGDRKFGVDRRDDTTRAYTCPIELVAAALGS